MCPACASGKVVEEEGKASCQDCGWEGTADKLIVVPVPTDTGSLEINQDQALEIAKKMSEEYMKLIYKTVSVVIGRCIMATGLVGRRDTTNLTRLIRAACFGAHRATFDEVEKIAAENKANRVLS